MQTTTTFISAGTPIQTELFHPSGAASQGAIVIAHGSDGLIDNASGPWLTMMRGYAGAFADKGFVALLPGYFGGAKSVSFAQLSVYQSTIADAVTHAKSLPGVQSSRIGLLGFSLGGYLCLRNRALAKVLVEFFAPELPELGGLGTGNTHTPYAQIHHGYDDELVPLKPNAESIERRLRGEGTNVTLFRYAAAGHGFSGKHANDAKAQQKSRERTLAFFEANL